MTALLILLTPVLMLAIVALFGFVGCSFSPAYGLSTVVATADKGTSSVSATLGLNGGELLVATVQWGGTAVPTFTGAQFQPSAAVNNGNAFSWNGMNVQVFSGINPAGKGELTVTAALPSPSTVSWSLSIWPYVTKAPNPLYGAVSTTPNFQGKNIQAPPINLNKGDALYAVAFAADTPVTPTSPGTFPGNNPLSAPMAFTTFADVNNPLLEGIFASAAGQVIAQATNNTTDPNNARPRGFMVAVGVAGG